MQLTGQQEAFIASLVNGSAHIALIARAGCGKTSTIIEGVKAYAKAHPRSEVLICAYNKAIADEVSAKVKALGFDWRAVQCSTVHSMGFGLVKYVFKPAIDDKKVLKLIDAQNADIFREYPHQIAQLVRFAKQAGFGFFSDCAINDNRAWHALADHFDVNGLDDTSQADEVMEAAQHVYRASLAQTDIIDFDDMILFPLVKNLSTKFTKDLVVMDEAQDTSRARQALARKFLKAHSGRMIVVGDDRQAIYGFTGADAAALPNLIDAFQMEVLPLSVTWRCPKSVVALAQTLVPDIEAAPSAAEGEVLRGEDAWTAFEAVGSTDAILCRNTAPLIKTAYGLIRAGKACRVEGRNIGEGLIQLARRWRVRTIDALMNRIDTYQDRETQKAMAKGNEAKVEEVEDRCETLREVCRACIAQGKTTIDGVVAFIESLFADLAQGVTILATYHRSKGREWPRVFLMEHNQRCPSKMARQDWQKQQEANLAYVAFTRAQQTLAFVE